MLEYCWTEALVSTLERALGEKRRPARNMLGST